MFQPLDGFPYPFLYLFQLHNGFSKTGVIGAEYSTPKPGSTIMLPILFPVLSLIISNMAFASLATAAYQVDIFIRPINHNLKISFLGKKEQAA